MSNQEHVRFPGVLRGQLGESKCEVEVLKVSVPGPLGVAYGGFDIVSVEKNLPDD